MDVADDGGEHHLLRALFAGVLLALVWFIINLALAPSSASATEIESLGDAAAPDSSFLTPISPVAESTVTESAVQTVSSLTDAVLAPIADSPIDPAPGGLGGVPSLPGMEQAPWGPAVWTLLLADGNGSPSPGSPSDPPPLASSPGFAPVALVGERECGIPMRIPVALCEGPGGDSPPSQPSYDLDTSPG